MIDEELAAIEQRLQAATPGPWAWSETIPPCENPYRGEHWTGGAFVNAAHELVCHFGNHEPYDNSPGEAPNVADTALIVHASTDLAALVAEVRRLQAALPDMFDAGFANSGEGWNNEYPREFTAEQQQRYEADRAVAVREALMP